MLRGAQWRQEQAARLVILAARTTAVLMRQKRIPSLKTLFRDPAPRRQQTPGEQRAVLLEWASRAGKKKRAVSLGRLEQPFDPTRLDPTTSPSMARRVRG